LPSEVVGNRDPKRHVTTTKTVGWNPSCSCGADTIPCTVLDPFLGSGTTAMVAKQFNRHYVGIELNPEYLAIAQRRVAGVQLDMLSSLKSPSRSESPSRSGFSQQVSESPSGN